MNLKHLAKSFINRAGYVTFRILYAGRSRGVVDRFHEMYFDAGVLGQTWADTYWFGVPIQKCPMDLWNYQELVFRLKPDLVVECGTASGGSAYYLASLLDLIGHGEVVTVDVAADPRRPTHRRITYLEGSSVDPGIVSQIKSRADGKAKVLVILDSDHRKAHVLQEIRAYGPMVTSGSYMVVEDTNLNGHPVDPRYGEGPMEAVEEFLKGSREFSRDKTQERFLLTFFPSGWLRKA